MNAMSDTPPQPDAALRARLEQAADGLLYTSESDYPFEFVFFPGAGDTPPGVDAFAVAAGAAPDAPRQERTLERFFAPHVERSDPADAESQRLRPRYEALRELLRTELRGTTVYRIGEVEIQCYVVGGDGHGNLAGLRTVAVET
jgi:Nuclease A inhibitor-like protein